MLRLPVAIALTLSLSTLSAVTASAQSLSALTVGSSSSYSASTDMGRFVPRPSIPTQIDYTVWDQLLKEMVYYAGLSLRQRAPKPLPVVGTRFVHGHVSPYRLEGNRVVFETFGDEFKSYITDYTNDLVRIGNRLDIPALSRKEQLSYWLNLHNALVIQAIADQYPTGAPSRLKGADGLPFHDTKRVTIHGVALSLRNIREDIVYRNWSDPMVIYGFFHGDIGSPSIQRKAFTAGNLDDTLRFSANEFVNSLRAFHLDGRKARISRHYRDAAPYLFPDFEADLRKHLSSLMSSDVRDQLEVSNGTLTTMTYEKATADLTKGDADWRPISNVQSQSRLGNTTISSTLQRAISEQRQKMDKIRQRGLLGSVTITDIQTVDEDTEEPQETESP